MAENQTTNQQNDMVSGFNGGFCFFLGCDEAHLNSKQSINETVDVNWKQTLGPTTRLFYLFRR